MLSQAKAVFDMVTKGEGCWVSHDQGSPGILTLPQLGGGAAGIWLEYTIGSESGGGGFSDLP